MFQKLLYKALGITTPREMIPFVSAEEVSFGGRPATVVRLTNMGWCTPFRLKRPVSVEALAPQPLQKRIQDLTRFLSDKTLENCLLSFLLIKNQIKAFGGSPRGILPSGVRLLKEYIDSHTQYPHVRMRSEQALKGFSWDVYGSVTLWEKKPRQAIQKMERLVLALSTILDIETLSPVECVTAAYHIYAPWRRVPEKLPGLIPRDYFLAGEATLKPETRDRLLYDGHYIAAYKLSTILDVGSKENENTSPIKATAPAELLLEAPMSLKYFVNIFIPPQDSEAQKVYASRGFAKSTAYLGGAAAEENKEKVQILEEFLKEIARTNQNIVKINAGYILAEEKPEALEKNAVLLTRMAAGKGLGLIREGVSLMETVFLEGNPIFAGKAPGCALDTTAEAAAAFTPWAGPFIGGTPDILLMSRYGVPAGISLTEKSAAKWGTVIIAPSGSGKTFFTNCLFLHTLSLKEPPFVVILDMSTRPSYLGLVATFQGLHLNTDLSKGSTAINPLEFKFPLKKPPQRHLAFLTEKFFPALLNKELAPSERTALELAVEKTFEQAIDPRNPGFSPKRIEDSDLYDDERFRRFETFLEARDFYLQQDELILAELAHRQAMPTLADLVQTLGADTGIRQIVGNATVENLVAALTSFTAGPYSAFFTSPTGGKNTFNFDTPLIYVELSRILNYPSLLPAVFLLVRNYLIEKTTCFSEDLTAFEQTPLLRRLAERLSRIPKIFTYDEWHNLKNNQIALSTVDYDFRQGRTMRRIPILISQSALDVNEEAILVNTSTKILLTHLPPDSPDETALAHSKEVFALNEALYDMLRSLRIVKGQFSEALVISESKAGAGVVRLYPTPEEFWMVTSDAVSLSIRERLTDFLVKELNLSHQKALVEAVKRLAKLAPHENYDNPEALLEKAKQLQL